MFQSLKRLRIQKVAAFTFMVGLMTASLLSSARTAVGQEDKDFVRPKANQILPEETVLYARIPSFPAFFEEFGKSGFSKMIQDERVSPFLNGVYGDLKSEYDEKVKDKIGGIDLEQFKDFATGELCFAMVAKRRKPLTMVMFFDVPEESQTLDQLLGVAAANGVEKGDVDLEEDHGVAVNYYNFDGNRLLQFRVGNTVFFCNDEKLCEELLANIHGKPLEKTRTFHKNRKYRSVMSTCNVTPENPALLSYFVDPIKLTKAALRGNPAGFMVNGALPVLGLDGVLAIGGASLKGDDNFEAIAHMHLLLANPRGGLLQAISLKKNSFELSPLVPEDAGFILQGTLNIPKLYTGVRGIVDTFNKNGFFEKQIEQASDFVGFDLKTKLIDNLNGEVSMFNWDDPESTAFNSNSNAYLIGYKNRDQAMEVFDMLLEKADEDREESRVKENKHAGIKYYTFTGFDRFRERRRQRREEREKDLDADERERRQRRRELSSKMFRQPSPAFAFFENHLVIADNERLLEHIIDTSKGRVGTLEQTDDYQLVKKHCERILDGKKPSGIMFSRPSKQLAPLWDALRDPNLKEMVGGFADQSADNEDASIVRKFNDTLNKHELPSFEEFKQNFAAQGGFVIDESNGIHIFTFNLKPDLDGKRK